MADFGLGGTAAGATIGALAGPWGAAIGGVIGFGVDLYNFFTGAGADAKKTNLETTTQLATTNTELAEDTAKRSAYQDFIAKLPTAGKSLAGSTGDSQVDQQYNQLLSNFANLNVMAGVTGNGGAGSTTGALGTDSENQMQSFIDVQRDTAQRQIDAYGTSIDALNTAKTALEDVQTNPDVVTSIGNWFNQLGK